MESDYTSSYRFTAMDQSSSTQTNKSAEAALLLHEEVHWICELSQPVHDGMCDLLKAQKPLEGLSLSDSTSSPVPAILTESAQIATDNLLSHILTRAVQNDETPAPIFPYEQVAEMGAGMAIYNAAFLPGWPAFSFTNNANVNWETSNRYERKEAEIANYLAAQGVDINLLSKALKFIKTAPNRVGFLVWFGLQVCIVAAVLQTFNKETTFSRSGIEPNSGPRKKSRSVRSKNRQFLKL